MISPPPPCVQALPLADRPQLLTPTATRQELFGAPRVPQPPGGGAGGAEGVATPLLPPRLGLSRSSGNSLLTTTGGRLAEATRAPIIVAAPSSARKGAPPAPVAAATPTAPPPSASAVPPSQEGGTCASASASGGASSLALPPGQGKSSVIVLAGSHRSQGQSSVSWGSPVLSGCQLGRTPPLYANAKHNMVFGEFKHIEG